MTMYPGTSLYYFSPQPVPTSIPGPPNTRIRGHYPHPMFNSSFPPGNPQVLPAAPTTLLVTGDGGPVTSTPGADKVILQVREQGEPAQTPQTQSVILPQTPHISHYPHPVLNPSFPPGNPQVLPAIPTTLFVTGGGGPVTSTPGADKVILQVGKQGGPAETPQTQSFTLLQTPHISHYPQPIFKLSFPPGNPQVLPAAPTTLLVTGDGGPVTSTPGADKVILQVREQRGPAQTPQTQTVILPQTPHISYYPHHVFNPSFPPGNPQVLPAVPTTLLVTGDGGPVTSTPEVDKVILQVREQGGPAQTPQTQSFILPQTPHISHYPHSTVNPSFPPGNPQVLPAVPTLLVTGDGGPVTSTPGADKVILQVRERGPAQTPQTQSVILPQTPHISHYPQPIFNSSFPPGNPQVLPAVPTTLLVTGDGGPVTSTPGADKVILQGGKQGGPADTPQTQSVILPQTPHISGAKGILCVGVNQPPPENVRPSALQPMVPAMTLGGTEPGTRGWSPGFPPQAPQQVTILAPNVHSGNALPRPQGASGEGGVASAQLTPSPDDSCKPKSVYENFRCWQRYKPLAQRYFHLSPDAEALACFFIPVLRSLARRKPTMSLEERLHRAVQEWQWISNSDRMIYYEMARKFKEFETEEERQTDTLQKMSGPRGPPRTAPPKLRPLVPKGNVEGQQPASIPKKAGPKAQFPRQRQKRHREPQKTKAPKEIPAEAAEEYLHIMDGLVGSLDSAPEADGKWDTEHEQQQQEDGIYTDPDLLAYIDELCAEEDFVTKVEAVINPKFVQELLSPGADIDLVALMEELQKEEGLTPTQLAEKRRLAFKDGEGAEAAPSSDRPKSDTVPPTTTEMRNEHSLHRGNKISTEGTWSGRADNSIGLPKNLAVPQRSKKSSDIPTKGVTCLNQQRSSGPKLDSRDEDSLCKPSAASSPSLPGLTSRGEDLQSLAFLFAPQHSIFPRNLSMCLSSPGEVQPSKPQKRRREPFLCYGNKKRRI